ncbi:[pyruvate dehydrogenase (acetyl-transferring)]-phosphatase [Malassezia vespertilionis]|uniref:PPM-type phosphatase domain-containing protein n=1 Tax=Malassezia vespertilionis TaxID=2020962 RepID=A0A2N1JCH1_9BASI|nr:[pyruvate dehydrogenase (acetyl-transferring)]-phosphatase [Malassezia vespertilionis]PKI84239.1 hypothetical protein MVES_001552 [Malassezia vespertilionis]WFD06305.1 [pyruvate dehydrogenase (acetyl-transferring)]-phosphatase [Malassezia vespertilionis]
MHARQSPGDHGVRKYSTKQATFAIPVRRQTPGDPSFKVITPLSQAEVDTRLRAHERSTKIERPPGACLVARYDTNTVASNDPIEDKHAEVIVERDRGVDEPLPKSTQPPDAPRGDLCFFTVMDGHGGPDTSTMLSEKLVAFVALELDKVFRETGEYAKMGRSHVSTTSAIWHSLFGGDKNAASHRLATSALDGDPAIVQRAIVKGFRGLDKEIVTTPLELLKQCELSLAAAKTSHIAAPGEATNSLSSLAHTIWPSNISGQASSSPFVTVSQTTAQDAMLPALSGSCALMLYVDSARRDLYVANTGDSRAVAGYWDERNSRWEVEALSVDQTGRNPEELKRIQREHPSDENDTVIQRGRVLGGLEPTRAFGDARYKWDASTQKRLYDAFWPGGYTKLRPPPRNLKTPPYVTAEPVVAYRKVTLAQPEAHDAHHASPQTAAPQRQLRFIIMASDGLWDLMSNQEAVGLVAGHLAGIRGTVRAADLQQRCFQPATPAPAPATSERAEDEKPQHPLNKSPNHLQSFTFEDDNLSTHLLRNAFGGAARERVQGLLAIPSPESRRYRDDITVNVILFHTTQPARGDTKAPVSDPARAKL